MNPKNNEKRLPHVVILGGGFGGLTAAKTLKNASVEITLLDRTNHHLFQPLLYQVAASGLSPAEIATPIRSILAKQRNVKVLLGEATNVDFKDQTVFFHDGEGDHFMHYDYLIMATGGRTSYFGHDQWEQFAPGLKDLDDAVEIRRRVLMAFEAAEIETDPERRKELLTFVVVGGGPTGVELAGAVAELAKFALARDFRAINPTSADIILLEGGPRILPAFSEDLSASGVRQLENLGIKVEVGAQVTDINDKGVKLGDGRFIRSATVIWGAGVCATAFTRTLGVKVDRAGRININPDLTVPEHNNVYAVGDIAFLVENGKPVPGVSPAAMQMGRQSAKNIINDLNGKPHEEFRYLDKGSMATIGRKAAVANVRGWKFGGTLAWLAWLFVHIFFLIGFRNRTMVLFNWGWSYITYKRGARLITGRRLSLLPRRHIVENENDEAEETVYKPESEFIIR